MSEKLDQRRAILLVDHGSRRSEANRELESLARELRTRRPEAIVEVAHLEIAQPSIERGLEACVEAGAVEIAVHPFFLSPGRHTTEDIPRLVEEAARRHPDVDVRITPHLGASANIVDLILGQVDE